jgi:hypothetical protein
VPIKETGPRAGLSLFAVGAAGVQESWRIGLDPRVSDVSYMAWTWALADPETTHGANLAKQIKNFMNFAQENLKPLLYTIERS